MNYKATNIKCLHKIIVSELYNTLSINIEPLHIKELKVTKLEQLDGESKYAIYVRKIYVKEDSFSNHPCYIKHSVSEEYVDCFSPGSMEDVCVMSIEKCTNIYFELSTMYHNICQAIIDNDFLKIGQLDVQNIIENKKLYGTVSMYAKVQNQIVDINNSINNYIADIN